MLPRLFIHAGNCALRQFDCPFQVQIRCLMQATKITKNALNDPPNHPIFKVTSGIFSIPLFRTESAVSETSVRILKLIVEGDKVHVRHQQNDSQ